MPTLNYVVRPQDLYGYSIYDILLFSGLPFQHCIDEATLTLCNCVGKKIGKLVRDHFFTIISIRSDYSAFNSVFPFVRFFLSKQEFLYLATISISIKSTDKVRKIFERNARGKRNFAKVRAAATFSNLL